MWHLCCHLKFQESEDDSYVLFLLPLQSLSKYQNLTSISLYLWVPMRAIASWPLTLDIYWVRENLCSITLLKNKSTWSVVKYQTQLSPTQLFLPLCQLQVFRKVEEGTLSTLFGITYYSIVGMARLDILPVTLQIEYIRDCFDLRILLPWLQGT